jgi:uncharacterized protein (DUF697 family)
MIEKKGVPVRIYDTVGLELNQDTQKASIDDIQRLINEKSKSQDISEMIHLVWYCVSVESERFEPVEAEFVTAIASNNVPVLMVATKAFDKALTDRFITHLNSRNLSVKKVMPVLACKKLDFEAYGVDELVESSVDLLPEAVQKAFINAANSAKLKRDKARRIIWGTVTTNFAVGFTPIPFSDTLILTTTEVTMLGAIAVVYRSKLDKNQLASFASALTGGGGGAAVFGKFIFSNLIKLIPGVGQVVGGIISGTTAAVLTYALGEAFIVAMDIGETQINSKEVMEKIKKVFSDNLKIAAKKFKKGVPAPKA